jgi:DNA-binding XRE family transcriptional regulator
MSVQVISKDGKPEYAVIPYSEYERLLDDAEMLADIRSYDEVKTAIREGPEELVPAAVADALIAGENPVRVWRRHRKLTLQQVADACGVTPTAISQIESGRRNPSMKLMKRLTSALNVAVDDIMSHES